MSEKPELLPCPFCGGEASEMGMGGLVGCLRCGIARRDAKSWNRRAAPAALADAPEVAALIREAEARGMERAAEIVQREAAAANVDAEDAHSGGFSEAAFHIRQAAEAIASTIPAIRAEAAAMRKGETT